jgi:signal transduction histidine kinase
MTLGILAFRMLGGLAPFVALFALHGPSPQMWLLSGAWALIVTATAVLAATVRRRHLANGRLVRGWLIADSIVAVLLNLGSIAVVPGSVQGPFGDVFWFYAMTTVAAWWLFEGPRAGVVALTTGGLLAWVIIAFDPDRPPDMTVGAGVAFVATHVVWLLGALVALLVAGRLVQFGSRAALADGLHLGRRRAEVRMLQTIHDTVLQTLESIALRGSDPSGDPRHELRAVAEDARRQAHDLRHLLQQPWASDDLRVQLTDLQERFRRRLDVELDVPDGVSAVRLSGDVATPLYGAVHEALTNVVKHAGVGSALITVQRLPNLIRVVVSDSGRGFAIREGRRGYGLEHSITRRMEEAGGDATVRSEIGRGTAVMLEIPAEPPSRPAPRRGTDREHAVGTGSSPGRVPGGVVGGAPSPAGGHWRAWSLTRSG